jgi:hypothetical protein
MNVKNMNNDVTVVIRSVGERTEELCKKYIIDSGIPEDCIFIVSERPFSNAMKKSFELGIFQGKKWTFCCDADVLLKAHSLSQLIKVANNQSKNIFEIQGYVLDKFFGGMRTAGNHLYRTSLLKKGIELIPEEGIDIRPEYNMLKAMDKAGHPWILTPIVMGLHDFEQYNKDIYRKSIVHSRKHMQYTDLLVPYWNRERTEDEDFLVALKGYLQGLEYQGKIYINDQDSIFSAFDNNSKKIIEKREMSINEYDGDFVENIINSWKNPKEYSVHFPVSFSTIRYSNFMISFLMKLKFAAKEVGIMKAFLFFIGDFSYLVGKKLKSYAKS